MRILRQKLHVLLTSILGLLLSWPLLVAFPINGGDALWVAQSSRALVTCARDDVWSKCPGTYQFGWLQHAPAIFLAWKGLSDDVIVFILTLINLLAFAWLLFVLVKKFKVENGQTWLLLACVLLGPLYAFSVYSFSEMLTFVLLAILVIRVAENKSLLSIVLLTFIISSSRETAFATVLPVVVAIFIVKSEDIKTVVKKTLPILMSSFAGLLAVFVFNIWKYGSIANDHYADPIRRVPGVGLKLRNFVAIWISPGGGVLPFWFLGGVVTVVVLLLAIRLWRSNRTRAIAAAILLLSLVFQTALLSAWYAPFGWVTWGPRLIIPVVGSVLITNFVLFPELIQRLIEFVRYRYLLVASLSVVTYFSAVSNVGFILDRTATLQWFSPPLLPGCPEIANIEINQEYYWECALKFVPWQLGPTLWDMGLQQVTRGWAVVFGLFIVAITIGIFRDSQSTRLAMMTEPPANEGIFDKAASIGRMKAGSSGKGTPTA